MKLQIPLSLSREQQTLLKKNPPGFYSQAHNRGQPQPAAALDTTKMCLGTWGKATGAGDLSLLINGQEARELVRKKNSYRQQFAKHEGLRGAASAQSGGLYGRQMPSKIRRATPHTQPFAGAEIRNEAGWDFTLLKKDGTSIRMSPPSLYVCTHIEMISLIKKGLRG